MKPYFLIFIYLIGVQAQSQTLDALEDPLSYEYNVDAFRRTRALCQDVESTSKEIKIDNFGVAKFLGLGLKNGAMIWSPESFKVSTETSNLIHSEGFKAALYSCFGSNNVQRKAFVTAIVGGDIFGHLVGISLWILPVTIVARMFRKTGWALSHPRAMSAVGRTFSVANKLGLLAIGGYIAIEEYNIYKRRVEGKQRFADLTDNVVDSSRQEMLDSYGILRDLLKETNEQLEAAGRSGDLEKQKTLSRRKAILEERLKGHESGD